MTPVLFARGDSFYKTLAHCDVYDRETDAKTFSGSSPVVGHPPCRQWSRLRGLANPDPAEKALAPWCVALIRRNGGILEHPASSDLWRYCKLPRPGQAPDSFGGWTLEVLQCWWGHKADKKTWLYIVGCTKQDLPGIPCVRDRGTHVVSSSKRRKSDGTRGKDRPELTKAAREHTPPLFAHWLIQVAQLCGIEDLL